MIKFFRSIRQKLLNEGKTSRYLKYAIGEIILVMIGILLALQVNNWNEGRKRNEKKAVIYQELINNIQLDLIDLEENNRNDSLVTSSIEHVIHIVKNKMPYDSTMPYYFGRMSMYTNFFHNKSAYENLKSTGFDYITNDSLRFAIIRYYDRVCNYLINIENRTINTHEEGFIQPFMMEHFRFSSFFEPAYPNDYDSLLNNEKLISILSTKNRLFEWKKERGLIVIDEGKKLIDMINEELNALNK